MLTSLNALDAAALDLLFREARTANTFTSEPVSDETVAHIYDLVKLAPTAWNAQPLRIVLVRSPEARRRLTQHLIEPNRDKTLAAPLTAILAADLNFHEHLPRTYPPFPMAKDLFFSELSARDHEATFNTTLQIGYFILAVRAAGLAAGPMGGFDADGLAQDFFGNTPLKPLLVVNIGRPGPGSHHPERLPRLDYDEVVTTI